jgi:hypothetical protein
MEDPKAMEARRQTTRQAVLVAPHLAAVGTAGHLPLPLLDLLARISLAIALREASEEQTGGRGQDTVGNAERRSSASRPDAAANVVDIGQKRVDRLGTKRYGPSRPGPVRSRLRPTSRARGLGVRLATEQECSMGSGRD